MNKSELVDAMAVNAGISKVVAKKALELLERNEDFWMISNLTKSGVFGLYSKNTGFWVLEDMEWILPYLGRSPKVIKEAEEEYKQENGITEEEE